jgi:hypothetical protein
MSKTIRAQKSRLQGATITQKRGIKKIDFGRKGLLFSYPHAGVAQSVEQRPEKPCVGGSIPSLGMLYNPAMASLAWEVRTDSVGRNVLNI